LSLLRFRHDRRVLLAMGTVLVATGFVVGAAMENNSRTWLALISACAIAFLAGTWKRASP
jgi:uncharacterized membrane-anchored protein YjiN (DUF445 family)